MISFVRVLSRSSVFRFGFFRVPSRLPSYCYLPLPSTCRLFKWDSSPIVSVLYETSSYTCHPEPAIYTWPLCQPVTLLIPWYSTPTSCLILRSLTIVLLSAMAVPTSSPTLISSIVAHYLLSLFVNGPFSFVTSSTMWFRTCILLFITFYSKEISKFVLQYYLVENHNEGLWREADQTTKS